MEQLSEKFESTEFFDIININIKSWQPKVEMFDVVVMNPPFGTKDEGIDSIFLDKAFCKFSNLLLYKILLKN